MVSPLPPPPIPPPAPPSPPYSAPPINNKKELSPDHRKKIIETQRKLISELIFPPFIPRNCMPNANSIGKLLASMKDGNNGDGDGDGDDKDNKNKAGSSTSTTRNIFAPDEWERLSHPAPEQNSLSSVSPFQYAKHIDRSCKHFKLKHLQAKLKALDAKEKAMAGAKDNNNNSGGNGGNKLQAADGMVIDEDLASTYEEEKARAIIHEMNYKFCLSQVACPERMNRLASCWSRVGPINIRKFNEAGQERLVCRNEREAVERCSGALVQQLMRVAIAEA